MKELIKLNPWGYKNWQQWWFDDVFAQKYVHLCCFNDFTSFLKVFINIYKNANSMIYKSDHGKKDMCLSFNLTPILVL